MWHKELQRFITDPHFTWTPRRASLPQCLSNWIRALHFD